MSDRPVRFGVLGLGMGRHHCLDLVDAAGCELAAICDANAPRLEQNRLEFGVRAYARFEDMLADPEVEVVNICTPSGTHADLSIQALRAGKHVVCEKPPDVTVEAVDRMIAARDAAGRKLMVIFQSRFEPVYQEVRRAIDAGRLGRLAGVHGEVHWWREPAYFHSPGNWKGTWKMDGGGSLANQGVHTLDVIQFLAGRVVEVYGKYGLYFHAIETEDKTAAVLTFANGAIGTLTTSTCAYPGLNRSILVHGGLGSIRIEDDKLTHWHLKGDSPEAEAAESAAMLAKYGPTEKHSKTTASDPFAFTTRGHLLQFEAMAQAVRGDTEPPNSIETTRHTVELFRAVYESSETGRPIRLGA